MLVTFSTLWPPFQLSLPYLGLCNSISFHLRSSECSTNLVITIKLEKFSLTITQRSLSPVTSLLTHSSPVWTQTLCSFSIISVPGLSGPLRHLTDLRNSSSHCSHNCIPMTLISPGSCHICPASPQPWLRHPSVSSAPCSRQLSISGQSSITRWIRCSKMYSSFSGDSTKPEIPFLTPHQFTLKIHIAVVPSSAPPIKVLYLPPPSFATNFTRSWRSSGMNTIKISFVENYHPFPLSFL